jgi:hypothetical protein
MTLDDPGHIHAHTPEFAHPPKVIAHQVHDHRQFRTVLGAARQILLTPGSQTPRPLHRTRRQPARRGIKVQEQFRACARQGEPATIRQIRLDVGTMPRLARIAQRPPQCARRSLETTPEPVRKVHLVYISRADVLEHARRSAHEPFSPPFGLQAFNRKLLRCPLTTSTPKSTALAPARHAPCPYPRVVLDPPLASDRDDVGHLSLVTGARRHLRPWLQPTTEVVCHTQKPTAQSRRNISTAGRSAHRPGSLQLGQRPLVEQRSARSIKTRAPLRSRNARPQSTQRLTVGPPIPLLPLLAAGSGGSTGHGMGCYVAVSPRIAIVPIIP